MSKKTLITAALPYVNNSPHLGNVIGSILSGDVYSRYRKLRYPSTETVFICGTDEYGSTSEVQARKAGIGVMDLCTSNYNKHVEVYKWFNINFSYFGRTTIPEHTIFTQSLFKELYLAGHFNRKFREQFFCTKCNLFLADRCVEGLCPKCNGTSNGDQCDSCGSLNKAEELKEPHCKLCGGVPNLRLTEHLYFDVGKFKSQLESYSKEGFSKCALRIVKEWLKKDLDERSMTRDLKWGIKVPVDLQSITDINGISNGGNIKFIENFEDKTFYVWFDAPIAYITFTYKCLNSIEPFTDPSWDIVQFMGKDNVPFHSVIFPSMLFGSSTYKNILTKLSSTEYLTFEGEKFSKSNQIGIFGVDLLSNDYGPSDFFRYYLIKIRPESSDTNFSMEDYIRNCRFMVNSYGNLLNRVLKFLYKRCNNIILIEDVDKHTHFIEEYNATYIKYLEAMEKIELKGALNIFEKLCAISNKYLQDNVGNTQVFQLMYSVIVNLCCVAEPFMPESSGRFSKILGIEKMRLSDKLEIILKGESKFDGGDLIFKHLSDEQIEKCKGFKQ